MTGTLKRNQIQTEKTSIDPNFNRTILRFMSFLKVSDVHVPYFLRAKITNFETAFLFRKSNFQRVYSNNNNKNVNVYRYNFFIHAESIVFSYMKLTHLKIENFEKKKLKKDPNLFSKLRRLYR